MAKLNLQGLRALREEKKRELARRDEAGGKIQIVIGMGTCGIAAGAKETFDEMVDQVKAVGLADRTSIRQTGCMGLCYVEPTVEVAMPGMPSVIYGKVTRDQVKELVSKHLVEKRLLDDHIFDRPAADIMQK